MFRLYRVKGMVRIPPQDFGKPLNEVATQILRNEYEGYIDPDLGIILSVTDVSVEELGVILPRDGATYHRVEYTILAYVPVRNEVVEGQVVSVKDFGIFVRIGPIDGLIHKSQIIDDYLEYDSSREALRGKETGLLIEKGDVVRARTAAISVKPSTNIVRVSLTMKQPYLGKLEWIKKQLERQKGGG